MWKVGDRVQIVRCLSGKRNLGIKGTVKAKSPYRITVEFDKEMGGHNDCGKGKVGCCWYFWEYFDNSEYAEHEGIIIRKIASKKNNYW